jgi:hypothetical protein
MSVSFLELSSLQIVRKRSGPTTKFALNLTGMEIYVHLTSRKLYVCKEK